MTEINVYEAMSTLRAVRRLRPDPIPDEVLQRVLQAAVWAPSGGNTQPWRVIAVKDVQKRQALQKLNQPAWQGFAAAYSKGLESLPADDWYTCAAVPIGYPVGRGHGPITRQSVEQMAYVDTWGSSG